MTNLAIIAFAVMVVSLFRERLTTLPLTGPMLFMGIGVLLGWEKVGILTLELENESVTLLAEVSLALLLYSDASRINIQTLRESVQIPARLLGIGLPLTIAMGTLVTALLLPDLGWTEAALVAAILAPTDAALGEAVVMNRAVPARIRQALNVESGLNDGLVVPVVALLTLLVAEEGIESPGVIVWDAVSEIGLGVVVGIAIAVAMVRAASFAAQREWTDQEGLRIVSLGAALGAYAASSALGGNGFIASFVCGLSVAFLRQDGSDTHNEFAEDTGELLASATFIVFGALLVGPALERTTWLVVLCAAGTLTIGRMLPVWIAMRGAGLRAPTVAFVGWFGPRGLASMVFGLILLSDDRIARSDDLFAVIVLVITASVVLHGVTAAPGAARYGQWYSTHGRKAPDMMEAEPAGDQRARGER